MIAANVIFISLIFNAHVFFDVVVSGWFRSGKEFYFYANDFSGENNSKIFLFSEGKLKKIGELKDNVSCIVYGCNKIVVCTEKGNVFLYNNILKAHLVAALPDRKAINSAVIINENTCYVSCCDQSVYKINLDNGSLKLEDQIQSNKLIFDQKNKRLYILHKVKCSCFSHDLKVKHYEYKFEGDISNIFLDTLKNSILVTLHSRENLKENKINIYLNHSVYEINGAGILANKYLVDLEGQLLGMDMTEQGLISCVSVIGSRYSCGVFKKNQDTVVCLGKKNEKITFKFEGAFTFVDYKALGCDCVWISDYDCLFTVNLEKKIVNIKLP